MDGTSPGNQPVAFGNLCGGAVQAGAMTCIIDPFNPWPGHLPTFNPAPYQPLPADQHTHYHFAPVPQKLTDEDVERIARRVVELLREESK